MRFWFFCRRVLKVFENSFLNLLKMHWPDGNIENWASGVFTRYWKYPEYTIISNIAFLLIMGRSFYFLS